MAARHVCLLRLAAVWLVLWLGVLQAAPAVAQTASRERRRSRNLAEHVVTQELVFRGRLVSVVRGMRSYLAVNGTTFPPHMVTDVCATVDSVLLGVAPDSVVCFSTLATSQFPIPIGPGSPIVAWGGGGPEDSWRIHGIFLAIGDDGVLHPPLGGGDGMLALIDKDPDQQTYSGLVRGLQRVSARHATREWTGAAAFGLVRVMSVVRSGYSLADTVVHVTCDPLMWIDHEAAAMPTSLTVHEFGRCTLGAREGDTLLVAVPPDFTGGDLLVRACTAQMLVSYGYIPVLQVPVGFTNSAIQWTGNRAAVRPMLSQRLYPR